jgi:hypothetical protein
MNKLQYALAFLKLGISCIPLHHRNKKPDVSLCSGGWEKYTTILSTDVEIYSWLASGWCNYGVVAGWNNLVVLDFDSLEWFDLWCAWARTQNTNTQYVVATSFKVLTARGVHVYLQTPNAINEKRIGIDVQAQRKFVVGPGCVHPNGTQYVPVGALQLVQVESIESILPVELFPQIARGGSCDDLGTFQGAPVQLQSNNTEYDAWQSAMFVSDMDLIATVKQRVRIETLFRDAHRTSADGRWLAALCPFHDDHAPSMWIDARRQICGCQVCGMKPMDCINLYARMHAMPESDAVRAMAQELGVWG